MQYISKGAIIPGSDIRKVCVNYRGAAHTLSEEESLLWLDGQFVPQSLTECPRALKRLIDLGVVEATDEDGELGLFRLLIGCIIVPLKPTRAQKRLDGYERQSWIWIKNAGLRPTIAELICLSEKGTEPSPDMLGGENRQNLVEAIYSADTIADTVLESLMEKVSARDTVVNAVFGLLRKKWIMLV
jgi:hypothetical protein